MKKITELKSSLFYRLVIYFIFMIIIPVLCFWWIYEKILNNYYTENVLATQQINMENSLSLLESSLDAAGNAVIAIGGNQELTYYLDYRSVKSNMPYGAFLRITSFCEELYAVTPYLSSLKIYHDSPRIIYASPFEKLSQLQMEENYLTVLEAIKPDEIAWKTVNSDTEKFPTIYGYRKLYTKSYSRCAGYVEVQLSPQLLSDYYELLSSLIGDSKAVLTIYQNNMPIYSNFPDKIISISAEDMESGYEIKYLQNQYRSCLKIPELDLYVVCSGRISDLNVLLSDNMPSLFISLIIILLLGLFILFFMNIVSLSKRIVAFSSFIRDTNPGNLLPFHPKKKQPESSDELDVLINTYNTLIQDKNTLISRIEKMELFTQAARYQALQEQIHPHFIYGTLETIRMTALQNKDKDAANMIFSLSSLIRYSISISTKAVTLQDELEIATHYLKIQKMRFGDRLEYNFHIEEKLLGMELPSFIIQPMLENAIVYGISKTLDDCTLTVDAYEDKECIVIKVSNTGLPVTPQRLQEVNDLLSGSIPQENFKGNRNGLALNNIRERMNIFFNGRASIRLALQDGCTATVITIDTK